MKNKFNLLNPLTQFFILKAKKDKLIEGEENENERFEKQKN